MKEGEKEKVKETRELDGGKLFFQGHANYLQPRLSIPFVYSATRKPVTFQVKHRRMCSPGVTFVPKPLENIGKR